MEEEITPPRKSGGPRDQHRGFHCAVTKQPITGVRFTTRHNEIVQNVGIGASAQHDVCQSVFEAMPPEQQQIYRLVPTQLHPIHHEAVPKQGAAGKHVGYNNASTEEIISGFRFWFGAVGVRRGRGGASFWLMGAYWAVECDAREWERQREKGMWEAMGNLEAGDEKVDEVRRWLQKTKEIDERGEARGAIRRQSLINRELVRIGAAAGRSDRFKVESILEWKWGGVKGTLRMALVKWQGLDLLGDGEEWEPSWEPKNRLTADLKQLDPAPTRPHSRAPVARHPHSRKSPRVAGVDPEPGIPAAEEKRRRTNTDGDEESEEPAEGRTGSGASGSTEVRRDAGPERPGGEDSAQRTTEPVHQMRKRSRNSSSERGGESAERLVRQREDQSRGRGRRRGGEEGHDLSR